MPNKISADSQIWRALLRRNGLLIMRQSVPETRLELLVNEWRAGISGHDEQEDDQNNQAYR